MSIRNGSSLRFNSLTRCSWNSSVCITATELGPIIGCLLVPASALIASVWAESAVRYSWPNRRLHCCRAPYYPPLSKENSSMTAATRRPKSTSRLRVVIADFALEPVHPHRAMGEPHPIGNCISARIGKRHQRSDARRSAAAGFSEATADSYSQGPSCIGRLIVKMQPLPGRLRTLSTPPFETTHCSAMERPRPSPLLSVPCCANGANMLSAAPGSRPPQ